jgi:competence protein ComEC
VAARRRQAAAWGRFLSVLGERLGGQLKAWMLADVGPGRLVPWLPVAFGAGIALYFAADREPAPWASVSALAAAATAAVTLRQRPVGFPVALAAVAAAAGFATATLKSTYVAAPVMTAPAFNVAIAGFVEVREERERSDRIVVRVDRMEAARVGEKPERVRVSVRKGRAPPVGSYVAFKARLTPPLPPLRPGGFDFARDLYFQGIGASGFVLGQIAPAEPASPPGLWLRLASVVAAMRDAIDARIRSVLSGDRGAIASALVTGKRDAISATVSEAMYVSSLAHVLSISGYHMAVVAGVVFFLVRTVLALFPALASRRPIKKWAALAALAAAAFYLVLSGAAVATQRSFIMTAVVLIAVMVNRPAITLRSISVAAVTVLLVAPEAIVHPSFQMSFAATLALVAAYQHGLPFLRNAADTSFGARVALFGVREIAGLILASVVAGLATMPYAAFHFHRLAPYGVLANLLAMPVVSAWVMPAGLLALIAMPFGFDAPFWTLMGEGIGWMAGIALWVANLPGALGRISAFGVGPLLLGTAGLIVICLLRTPLRWAGLAMAAVACVLAYRTPQPDIRIAADAAVVAVRGSDGRLSFMRTGRDLFAVREWLAADADGRKPDDPTLADGSRCDVAGCVARLADGRLVALAKLPEALAEDCHRAALVVSRHAAPRDCAARAVDREVWRAGGAIDLRWTGKGFEMTAARPRGHDRPWARAIGADDAPAAPQRPAARDATPRTEDLEAGD